MSQRCSMNVLSAELTRTIVRLCCSYLLLFVGLLFFLAFVILTKATDWLHKWATVSQNRACAGQEKPGGARQIKSQSADAARLPIWFLSGGHQGNTRNAISKTSPLPFSPSFHPSPPFKRYVLQMTEPSPNTPKMLLFFPPRTISLFSLSRVSVFGASPHGLGSI